MSAPPDNENTKKSPLREIVQPFIDVVHAPRALWGINLAYVLEGMVYFGMLGYLAIYFSSFVFQSVEGADEAAHQMVMVLTAGITIAMFFLGVVADKRGVRFALILAFCFMLAGRAIWAGGPNVLGLEPTRPGVFTGDRVSLHVERLETKNGLKTITSATLLTLDEGAIDAGKELARDLSAGEGVVPSEALAAQLVSVERATIVSGEEALWELEYGSAGVKSKLLASAAEQLQFCVGAVIQIKRGYVSPAASEATSAEAEYLIRTHWRDDFGLIDRSGCDKTPAAAKEEIPETLLQPTKRWAARPSAAPASAPTITLAELRDMHDGPTDVVLRDVYVSYVRNGGYLLQADAAGPAISAYVSPFGSWLQIFTVLGMLLVVIGYGMYQPAAYAGVRKFTTPKTAAMGFAMLYALMNLGGWLPTFAFLARDDDYLGLGIPGTFWVYVGFTLLALLATIAILTTRTTREAARRAKEETAAIEAEAGSEDDGDETEGDDKEATGEKAAAAAAGVEEQIRPHMFILWAVAMALLMFRGESPWYYSWAEASWRWIAAGVILASPVFIALIPTARSFVARHPLQDPKFAFFIFALIPVQTLFTYNWLVLPQYISRSYAGWIGDKFEIAANANPILIFILVPIITALTQKAKVYNMMIYGTFIMAAPAFLLVIGPYWWTLFPYIILMTIGEAMWQPRFLQYAAEIAPEGRTGEYMGVAQLPWFLTKVLVPLLYSGRMMDRFCPEEGQRNTQLMWLVFACIAISSSFLLLLGKRWVGKDFKTKAD